MCAFSRFFLISVITHATYNHLTLSFDDCWKMLRWNRIRVPIINAARRDACRCVWGLWYAVCFCIIAMIFPFINIACTRLNSPIHGWCGVSVCVCQRLQCSCLCVYVRVYRHVYKIYNIHSHTRHACYILIRLCIHKEIRFSDALHILCILKRQVKTFIKLEF